MSGVTPLSVPVTWSPPANDAALADRTDFRAALLEAVDLELSRLIRWAPGAVAGFFDVSGCMVRSAGGSGEAPRGWEVGAVWDRQHTGRTAITRALELGEQAASAGPEHAGGPLEGFFGAAAPVGHPGEMPTGALALYGRGPETPPFVQAAVAAAAAAVEARLETRAVRREAELQDRYYSIVAESINDGVLLVDSRGIVTYVNPAACQILGFKREQTVGRHVRELVDFRPVVLDVLETGEGYTDREFILHHQGRPFHFVKTAVPVRDPEGRVALVVDVFREIHRVREMVNRMTGAQAQFTFEDFIGESPAVREAVHLARIAAQSNSNVLIQGESGTGKEVLAQAMHSAGPRGGGPFIGINCAAIPRDLLEGELFGYEEGAFTGARKGGHPGKFELAHGGTILLDEISDMPLEMQVKLLRVLQDRRVMRLGGRHYLEVDCRIVAATNRDLARRVEEGHFRRDLYYRLNVLTISIPPLAERLCDIPLMVNRMLGRLARKLDKTVTGISPAALELLQRYHWPGNVRELENVMERAINLAEGPVLEQEHLPRTIQTAASVTPLPAAVPTLAEATAQAIQGALAASGGNIAQAARMLNVSRNTVYSWLNPCPTPREKRALRKN